MCHIPTTFQNSASKIPKGSLYITPEEPAAGLAEYPAGILCQPGSRLRLSRSGSLGGEHNSSLVEEGGRVLSVSK